MINVNDFKTGMTIKVEAARIERKPMQFLYSSGDTYTFMDMNDYSQVELDAKILGNDIKYLKENLDLDITFFEGEVLGISLPDKLTMTVTHTEPGVKGNTTSSAMKDATLETGLVIKVPLFVNEGEQVIISTSDGKYVSRA